MKNYLKNNLSFLGVALVMGAIASLQAQSTPGAWKERPSYNDSEEDGEKPPSAVKVWDSFPSKGLSFYWDGPTNAAHQAEGHGVLQWFKEENEKGDETVSYYTGQMKAGMREGRGTVRMASGATYRGEWLRNLKNGQGIYYYANGDCYEGAFADDKAHGKGTYTHADGTFFTGEFQNDFRNGGGTLTLPDGRKYESKWVNGVETPASLALRAALPDPGKRPWQVELVLDQGYMERLMTDEENHGQNALLYRSRFVGGVIQIEPNFEWLDDALERGYLETNGTIEIIGFSIGPAPLIVKVNHSGKAAKTIVSGRLQVEKSAPDLRPLIVSYGADSDMLHLFNSGEDKQGSAFMSLGFTNLGEGKASNCVLEYHLMPLGAKPPPVAAPFTRKLGELNEKLHVDLEADFIKLGVKPGEFASDLPAARAKEVLGPFARFNAKGKWIESNARLFGKLSYEWTDVDGQMHKESTDFQSFVIVDPRNSVEFGAPGPVEGDYHLALRVEGKNYAMPFPYRSNLPSGGNLNFRLRLCAPKVSDHRFQVILKCSDGEELRSMPVQLHYFMPRDYGKDFVKNNKKVLEAE